MEKACVFVRGARIAANLRLCANVTRPLFGNRAQRHGFEKNHLFCRIIRDLIPAL